MSKISEHLLHIVTIVFSQLVPHFYRDSEHSFKYQIVDF